MKHKRLREPTKIVPLLECRNKYKINYVCDQSVAPDCQKSWWGQDLPLLIDSNVSDRNVPKSLYDPAPLLDFFLITFLKSHTWKKNRK